MNRPTVPVAFAVVTLAGAAAFACASEPRPVAQYAPDPVALTGAMVIDGTGAPARPATILVRGDRIEALLEPGRALPAGARVRDLSGTWVMPGLIDGHVHLGTRPRDPSMLQAMLRAALLGGVTTVRDMGGSHGVVRPLAQAALDPAAASPRIFFSAVMAGPGAMWFTDTARARFFSDGAEPGTVPGVRMVTPGADAAGLVAAAAATGATGLKLYDGLDAATVRALTAAARAAGLRVWGHAVIPPATPLELVEAGVDVLSHADQPVWAAWTGPRERIGDRSVREPLFATPASESPGVARLIDAMLARGTILEPTLQIMTSDDAVPSPIAAWAAGFAREAHRRGVPISAGSDALIQGRTPNLHRELVLLVERVGLSPLEAIAAGTAVAARAIGADSLGTLQPGMLADLVVLAADPSVDVRNTTRVVAVARGGVWHEVGGGEGED